MNCRHCQSLLLREADHIGTAEERAGLEVHLAGCPDCRSLQADLRHLAGEVRAELQAVPVPDVAAEWRQLLRAMQPAGSRVPAHPPRTAWWWIAPPLAAAAALALLFLVQTAPPGPGADQPANGTDMVTARAEFVDPGNASATTMVFVDKPSGWLVVWASDTLPARKG